MSSRNNGGRDDDSAGDAPLAERAAAAARAELRGQRTGILGATGETTLRSLVRVHRVPSRWTVVHVMDRMEEGFRTLSRIPMAIRPRGYMNSMPQYVYDRGDLNAQLETHELERMANIKNRVAIARQQFIQSDWCHQRTVAARHIVGDLKWFRGC
jgi:hypothetical protein